MTDNNQDSETEESTTRKRVNISINSGLHKDATKYASDNGKHFSGLVTDALLREMDPAGLSTHENELNSIGDKIHDLEENYAKTQKKVEELLDICHEIADQLGPESEYLGSRIEDELEEADNPLAIPDMAERMEMSTRQIKKGVRHLEDHFVVNRIDPDNPESGTPRWKTLYE